MCFHTFRFRRVKQVIAKTETLNEVSFVVAVVILIAIELYI